METIKRGEIYYADLSPTVGSEQDGIRPVLILQNNIGNRFSQRLWRPLQAGKKRINFQPM